jgi:sugar/nucleoside kinase (ribokinase family)
MDVAVRHAVRAAALCVTRAGAQASMPSRVEVEAFAG